MKLIVSVGIQLLLLASNASAQEDYICAATAAGGVRFDEGAKRWVSAAFNPASKYLVRKPKPGDFNYNKLESQKISWLVLPLGTDSWQYLCENDFTSEGRLHCTGLAGKFVLNRSNLRFMQSYEIGYLDPHLGGKEGGDMPHIEIGECSRV